MDWDPGTVVSRDTIIQATAGWVKMRVPWGQEIAPRLKHICYHLYGMSFFATNSQGECLMHEQAMWFQYSPSTLAFRSTTIAVQMKMMAPELELIDA